MKKKILLTVIVIMLSLIVFGAISASAATTVNVSTVSELQSAHPYSSNMDTTWVYTYPTEADSLEITFSSDTATESNYDWIYILDGDGNQIEKQSGTTLAGKTVTVPGNIVKIRLTSDGSVTKNGFTVTNIEAISSISGTVYVSSVDQFQSAHSYANNMDKTWVYTHPTTAENLSVTFSSDTETENNYDYIYILDGNDNQIGKYSGTSLTGKTVTVPGNVVKIRLTSDSSQTRYGFRITNIVTTGSSSSSNEETYQAATYRNGYYEIANASQLYWFAQQVNSGRTSINGKLVANIVVNEGNVYGSSRDYEVTSYKKWKSIGSSDKPYSGIFNGNNYTISGLYFYCANTTAASEYGRCGSMFYKITGTIYDLNIENSYFYHYNDGAAICAFNSGIIKNCYVKARVQAHNRLGIVYQNDEKIIDCDFDGDLLGVGATGGAVGGICNNNNGEIINCTNTGDILDGGGICRYNEGTVQNCYNYGDIINGSGSYLGGICAHNYGTITGCTNEGKISTSQLTSYSYAGGICGENSGAIERCANLADISYYKGYVGGICGQNKGDGLGANVIKDCYNIGRVEASSPYGCGGIVGRNYANVIGCYHRTGNIYITSQSNTGTICGVNGYNTNADGYKGVIRNCIDFWYYSGYQIGTSESGSVSKYVYPSNQLYGTNAAYFLNEFSSLGVVNWRQNIDNGQTVDSYPVLDSSHGIVYSNNSNTQSASALPDNLIARGGNAYISWSLDKNGLLTVTLSQTSTSGYYAYEAPWYPYRDQILTVKVKGDNTRVWDYAFFNCTNLKSVQLSSNIQIVGERAFANCTSLKSIYISNGTYQCFIEDYAFYNCTSLKEASFSIYTKVGKHAFDGCTDLDAIYINSIGSNGDIIEEDYAFDDVVATVYYPRSTYMYALPDDFSGDLTLQSADNGMCGSDVKWRFDSATGTLTLSGSGSTTVYSSGTNVPWGRFNGSVSKIVVEEGITELPSYIFEYCSSAEEIILPNTLKNLAFNAFNDCEKLKNLLIPSSLENFTDGIYGFNRCGSLTDVYYVGTKEEFKQIPNYYYATYNRQTLHFLVWNEPSATCTEAGVEGYYSFDDISVYNTKYDINKNVKTYLNSVPATGHNIVWMEEIPANCHETGKKERWECENCGTIYTDKSSATERTDAIIEINPNNHHGETELRDATDGFTGNTYCLGCEQIISSGENIYKIKVSGTELAVVGSTEILKTVEVGTDKNVNALYCLIKYPDALTLKSITAKDFAYAELEDEYTEDGFTTAVILAQYSDTELIPKNVVHTPLELTFDVSKSAVPGIVQIEVTEESCLIGNDTYFFGERIPGTLEILPKLAESIEISGEDVISSEATYNAIVSPDYTTDKSIEWSVNDETIATVSEDGVVTPVTSGTFTLTATAKDGSGVSASKIITVTRGVTSIEIVGADSITEATTYSANITPDYATNKEVEWSISNTEIAIVYDNGVVTPITSGLVTITVTAKDGSGVSASKEINIIKLAESIEITGEDSISSPAQYTAIVSPDYTSDKEVSWSVDNEAIATVDELGIVTPLTSGNIILTAIAKDGSGVYATKTIEIVKFAESIEIVGNEEITEPSQYSVVILPEYTTNKNAEWSVSDESIATVDENGLVTPLKNGKIVLTAKAEDASGIETTKSIVITVSVRANSITSDVGVWDKNFDSDITEYTISVPSETSAIYLTSSFTNATAKVNGSVAVNGVRKKVSLTGTETEIEIVLSPTSGNNLNSNTYKITVACGSYTKTIVSEDGKSFIITPVNIENGKTVILALYDGQKLVEIKQAIYQGEEIHFATSKTYDKAKIFVWEDLKTMIPLCEEKEILLNN